MKAAIKLFTLLLIVNLTSCVLDDHGVPPTQVRIVKRETVGYGTYTYNYDETNRLAKETFSPATAITPYYYDFTAFDSANRLLEAIQYFTAFPDLGHEVLRDPDGKITRIRKYCVGGPTCTSGIWYFAYPTANTVEVEFWDNGSLFRGTQVYTFNSAGQIVETKSFNSADELTRTRVNTSFDDKRNMFSYYPEGFSTSPAANNNALTYQVTDHTTGTTTDGSVSYEYNSQGWVTKQIIMGEVVEIFEFESY